MIASAPSESVVRRSVVSLFAAYSVSFVTLGVSYLLYSRLLSPVQFGLYSTALVISTFGQFILDSGLKNTIIKAPNAPSRDQQGTVVFLMALSSVVLVAGLALGGGPIGRLYPETRQDYQFLATFGAIYLISYPWLAVPTAFLERRFAYRRIAFIESAGQVLERASPALFLLLTPLGMNAFLLGLLLGRLCKVIAFNVCYRAPVHVPTWAQVKDTTHLIAEGGWLQLGNAASQLRDGLYVLIVGPLFGQAWVGYYGWCLQMALITSQAFVQISSRVAVPYFAQSEDFELRWRHCLAQVRLMAILTAPVMMAALVVIPSVDAHLFHGKWEPALAILPLILLRMLPSLATTPAGALVMVHRGGRALAVALVQWTACEVVAGLALSLLLGRSGLAWSYATVVWVGLWLLLRPLGRGGWPLLAQSAKAILARPSLAVSVVLGGALILALGAAGKLSTLPYLAIALPAVAIVALAYLSEGEVRRHLPLKRPGAATDA